eukprot:COSAG01_NODE_1408_length_10418_cov_25.577478_2_plen_57_part_00
MDARALVALARCCTPQWIWPRQDSEHYLFVGIEWLYLLGSCMHNHYAAVDLPKAGF